MSEKTYVSFDGGLELNVDSKQIDKNADIDIKSHFISRGAGMSFCPASFGKDSTTLETNTKSVINFNSGSKLVEVGAGISVADLGLYLMDKGFYIKTVPGYPSITVGGCIASDAHGKNQIKDGTFQNLVESLQLFHPEHGLLSLSRKENKNIFDLTCGGFGLTGHILSAKLRVHQLPSNCIKLHTEELSNIYDLPFMLEQISKRGCDMLLSWHNFLLNGNKFGHGFVQYGSFAQDWSEKQAEALVPTLTAESRGLGWPPIFGFAATSLMNSLYTHLQKLSCTEPKMIALQACSFPSLRLRDLYFSGFGRKGFLEHQVIVPVYVFSEYIDRVKWWLSSNDLPVTIASSKYFGGRGRYLQFSGEGICFAMDFPRCPQAFEFLAYLDQLCLELSLLPNIIKDSRLSAQTVSLTYKEYEIFKQDLLSFDRQRLCQSELSTRLKI